MFKLVSLIIINLVIISASRSESGKCSYRFDVWKPDQDVIRKLDTIESYQKNISTHFNMELLKLRNDVLQEVISMKNATHLVEKEVLQQKVENVKLRIQQQEMQLSLLRQKGNDLQISEPVETKPEVTTTAISPAFVKSVGDLKTEVAKLQNSIGDLRAEWLLIKREIQKLRHSDNRLTTSFREMNRRMDTVQTMVNGMQSDALLIKRQQNNLMSENNGLGQKVIHVQKQNDELKQYQHRIRKSNNKIQDHLHRLRSENNHLHQSLTKVDAENSRLRDMLGMKGKNGTKVEYEEKVSAVTSGYGTEMELESLGLKSPPQDCQDLYDRGFRTSGLYRIHLDPAPTSPTEQVYCDMYNNSGWIVVQRRVDGLLKFNRGWLEYKFGFGNPYGEFYQGNEFLFRISNAKSYTLRIEMMDWEGKTYYADYDHFLIESEKQQYRLHVNKYHGTAGDSLSYHNDMSFSTEDMDNDVHVRNCAADYKGGWWYHTCYSSNLNGLYHTGWYSGSGQTFSDGVVWYTLKQSDFYSLRKVEMKLKPVI